MLESCQCSSHRSVDGAGDDVAAARHSSDVTRGTPCAIRTAWRGRSCDAADEFKEEHTSVPSVARGSSPKAIG
jgi:hypothetical protein